MTLKEKLLLPIAILASGIAFPFMWQDRVFPRWPTREKLDAGKKDTDTRFHYLKNITTEVVRADPQWWSKFYGTFVITVIILSTILWICF